MTQTIAKGKCAFHCGEPVQEGKRLCTKHLEHQRLKMADYRQKRKSRGLCSRCDNPARKLKNGQVSTLCESCRDHVRELERAARERVKRILRMRADKKTLKEISLKEGLSIEEIRQILQVQSN